MPVYSSKDLVKSGVPLGAIGAGKMEILPSGLLNAFTFMNNWSSPLAGDASYPGILGYHLGVSAEPLGAGVRNAALKKALLLQTEPVLGIPTVRSIRYEGVFPKARLTYFEPSLGLALVLQAFSPWIPGDAERLSLPVVFFTLRIKNLKKIPVRAGFLFIGRNVCGDWCVGRRNRIQDERHSVHLEFSNTDLTGSLLFGFEKNGWRTSFIESWNAVSENFSFNKKTILLSAWDSFVRRGELPNTRSAGAVQSENQELCGAVAFHSELGPSVEKEISFSACWYFPSKAGGHRYQKRYSNVWRVQRDAWLKRRPIQKKVERLQRLVFSMPFPGWFCDALLTNLAPFFSSSWYLKDGRFAFYEAPVVCPLLGTLDVGFYGSVPLGYFFPRLEIAQITQFADAQRPDGYIPHDLGRNRLDLPSDGTTFWRWKDLNPKFILMVYRDFLWSGDKGFLRKMYAVVKKAMAWSVAADRDGNGLPDHEGADQTFDLWQMRGAQAYTSSIFLAAVLASARMAVLMKDGRFSSECRSLFLKGRSSFERELWNGQYFGDTCTLSQLNGQWYAGMLGLGSIADPVKIRAATRSILSKNRRHSRYGMVNSVRADGRLDLSNDHSKNIWAGMNYAFLSLCVQQGFSLNDLLKDAYRIWDNTVRVQKNPWNQPDTVDSKTGRYVFGDCYYRNMAIWAIPIALSARDKKTARVLKALRSLG